VNLSRDASPLFLPYGLKTRGERAQLFGHFSELLLRPLPLGDVSVDGVDRRVPAGQRDGHADYGDVQAASVLPTPHALRVHAPPVRHRLRVYLSLISRLVGDDQVVEDAPDGLARRVAEDLRELPVDAYDAIADAHQGDGLRRLLEQFVEERPLPLDSINRRHEQDDEEEHDGD